LFLEGFPVDVAELAPRDGVSFVDIQAKCGVDGKVVGRGDAVIGCS
jgi:hypothetical protein